jgi:hypothetical protein
LTGLNIHIDIIAPNFTNFYRRIFKIFKIMFFMDGTSFRSTNKYGRQGQFLFLIGYCLKKSSPLKLLGKMEPNLAGSIYVRSLP